MRFLLSAKILGAPLNFVPNVKASLFPPLSQPSLMK